MANTTKYKRIIEPWVIETVIKPRYHDAVITSGKVPLDWGGEFNFDAVVRKDEKIEAVYLISCSEYKTQGGKGGAGKLQKIKADILMLLGTRAPKKVLIFTGITMKEKIEREQKSGRLPPTEQIQIEYVNLSADMLTIVKGVSAEAVAEVKASFIK